MVDGGRAAGGKLVLRGRDVVVAPGVGGECATALGAAVGLASRVTGAAAVASIQGAALRVRLRVGAG